MMRLKCQSTDGGDRGEKRKVAREKTDDKKRGNKSSTQRSGMESEMRLPVPQKSRNPGDRVSVRGVIERHFIKCINYHPVQNTDRMHVKEMEQTIHFPASKPDPNGLNGTISAQI